MTKFAEIFDSTSAFLRAKGISPSMSKVKVADEASIDRFQKQTGMNLPHSFSAFFTNFADGFQFGWQKDEDTWGTIAIPSLKEIAAQQQAWKRNVRDFLADPHSLDKCIDPSFRAEAFEIWRRMEAWIPFWDEGDGDHFCVDSLSGRIV